jgi:hypothetical protein
VFARDTSSVLFVFGFVGDMLNVANLILSYVDIKTNYLPHSSFKPFVSRSYGMISSLEAALL